MTPKNAVNLVLRAIELQDPKGTCDTLRISKYLAELLCQSDQLDIPRDVLLQEGTTALQKCGAFGYGIIVHPKQGKYEVDVLDSTAE